MNDKLYQLFYVTNKRIYESAERKGFRAKGDFV